MVRTLYVSVQVALHPHSLFHHFHSPSGIHFHSPTLYTFIKKQCSYQIWSKGGCLSYLKIRNERGSVTGLKVRFTIPAALSNILGHYRRFVESSHYRLKVRDCREEVGKSGKIIESAKRSGKTKAL